MLRRWHCGGMSAAGPWRAELADLMEQDASPPQVVAMGWRRSRPIDRGHKGGLPTAGGSAFVASAGAQEARCERGTFPRQSGAEGCSEQEGDGKLKGRATLGQGRRATKLQPRNNERRGQNMGAPRRVCRWLRAAVAAAVLGLERVSGQGFKLRHQPRIV